MHKGRTLKKILPFFLLRRMTVSPVTINRRDSFLNIYPVESLAADEKGPFHGFMKRPFFILELLTRLLNRVFEALACLEDRNFLGGDFNGFARLGEIGRASCRERV